MPRQHQQRPKTRELVRWDSDKDYRLLLGLHEVANRKGLKLPWDEVAPMIAPSVTANAIVQHLAKLRKKLTIENPAAVPGLTTPTAKSKGSWTAASASIYSRGKANTDGTSGTLANMVDRTAGQNNDPSDLEGTFGDTKPKRKARTQTKVTYDEDSDSDWESSPTKKTKSVSGSAKRGKAINKEDSNTEPEGPRKYYGGKMPPGHIWQPIGKDGGENTGESDDDDSDGEYRGAGADFLSFEDNKEEGDSIAVARKTEPSAISDKVNFANKLPESKAAGSKSERKSKVVKLPLGKDNLQSVMQTNGTVMAPPATPTRQHSMTLGHQGPLYTSPSHAHAFGGEMYHQPGAFDAAAFSGGGGQLYHSQSPFGQNFQNQFQQPMTPLGSNFHFGSQGHKSQQYFNGQMGQALGSPGMYGTHGNFHGYSHSMYSNNAFGNGHHGVPAQSPVGPFNIGEDVANSNFDFGHAANVNPGFGPQYGNGSAFDQGTLAQNDNGALMPTVADSSDGQVVAQGNSSDDAEGETVASSEDCNRNVDQENQENQDIEFDPNTLPNLDHTDFDFGNFKPDMYS